MSDIEDFLELLSGQQKKPQRQQSVFTALLRRLWHGGIGAITLFGLCLLMAWCIHFPLSKIHTSTTKMDIMFNKERDANRNNNVSYEIVGRITGWTTLTNKYDEVAVMMSRPVIERMLRREHVIDSALVYAAKKMGRALTEKDSTELIRSQVEAHAAKLEVSYADPTKNQKNSVITVSIVGSGEGRNRMLIGLVNAYNAYTRDYNDMCYKRTIKFLQQNIDSIRDELDKIDSYDENFSEENFIVDMEQQSSTYLNIDRDDEAEVRNMQLQRELLKIIRNYMSEMGENYVVVPANTGIDDAQINRIVIQFNDLVMRRSNYLTSMGEDAMRVKTITNQIEDQRQSIIISIDKLTQAFDIRLAKYEKNKEESEERLRMMPHKRIVKDKIDRDRAIITPLYTMLQQKLIETIVARSAEQDQARIVTPPYSVETNLLKSAKNIYLLGIILGIILASIYLWCLQVPVEKVNVDDVLKGCPLPIWGILPNRDKQNDLYRIGLQAVLTRIKMSGAKNIIISCGYEEDGDIRLRDDLRAIIDEEGVSGIVLSDEGDYHSNPKLPELSKNADATIYTFRAGKSQMRSLDFINYAVGEGLLTNGAVVVLNAKTNKKLPINFGAFDYDAPKGFGAVKLKASK
jgi:uncharacterized protein involved in exopolysaccharide biosynthesis